ncbi:MAG: type II toxin-antitoxin system RatA family toxin [Gammaproteobacteria bacterium]|nr:type II toxin-antitoxin system RatA family toxin [Gammaproteobacteria bacterium]
MRRIERSAIVPFSAESMFDLVADVPRYPEFLPGCAASRVYERLDDGVVAGMSLARGPLRVELRTCNALRRPESITMQLERGPFRALLGTWTFTAIGAGGSRVTLEMEFEFDNRAADLLLGPVFESLAGELVAAFAQRARSVLRAAPQDG